MVRGFESLFIIMLGSRSFNKPFDFGLDLKFKRISKWYAHAE